MENEPQKSDWRTYDGWKDKIDLAPFELEGATVTMTCWACPEQYDIDLNGTRIGYARLRWGHFHAAYPDVGGQTVYEVDLHDPWQGSFSPEERRKHLPLAVKALLKKHEETQNVSGS